MSLAFAVPCALLGALAYGASSAVQHAAAHTGRADARGLLDLVRNPRWLLSVGGDTLGLVFQVLALATGPVVVVQPILVLAVPASLPVGRWLGGPAPRRADYLATLAVIAGLGAFFVVVGDPGAGDRLGPRAAAVTAAAALAAGGLLCLAARGASTNWRAAGYGAVAGSWFGLVGVLLNAVATVWSDRGLRAFAHPVGWVPLAAVIVVGAAGFALTQVSFQVGALAAPLPGQRVRRTRRGRRAGGPAAARARAGLGPRRRGVPGLYGPGRRRHGTTRAAADWVTSDPRHRLVGCSPSRPRGHENVATVLVDPAVLADFELDLMAHDFRVWDVARTPPSSTRPGWPSRSAARCARRTSTRGGTRSSGRWCGSPSVTAGATARSRSRGRRTSALWDKLAEYRPHVRYHLGLGGIPHLPVAYEDERDDAGHSGGHAAG